MLGDFTYCNPTKLYFGKDALGGLNEELPKYGRNVLLVYGGGSVKKNGVYDKVREILKANGHREMVMIDASHSNSHKKFKEQITVVNDICKQVSNGDSRIIGVMIESNLVEGNQKIDLEKGLVYGQSVTDACLGWEDTAVLLNNLARAVRDRRSRNT